MDTKQARKRFSEALISMGKNRDVIKDTHGNLSWKFMPKSMFIKPSGLPYEECRPVTIPMVTFDDQGNIELSLDINGHNSFYKPSVDAPHHAKIYALNKDVNAICHTHSPYVVAHAIVGCPIHCSCTEQADYFGRTIDVTQYRDLDSWGAIDLGDASPPIKALVLGKHGGLTFGKDPEDAVNLAVQLENVAFKHYLATSGLQNHHMAFWHELPKEEIKKWYERYTFRYGQ